MPILYRPLVPHKNMIKCLLLAGIPIVGKAKNDTDIVSIMKEYEYKPLETPMYEEALEELYDIPGARAMIGRNTFIQEANKGIKYKKDKQALYIDNDVIGKFLYPNIGVDIMNAFSQNNESISKMGVQVLKILNGDVERQNIEILLMKGISFVKLSDILNERPEGRKAYSTDILAAYYHYFWNFRIIGSEGMALSEFANYMSIPTKSKFYEKHSNLCYLHMDEALSNMGYLGEDVRGNINKIIFGLASAKVIDALRRGERVKDYIFKAYSYADSSIAEEKKAQSNNDIKEKLNEVFDNIEGMKTKRMTLSDIAKQRDNEEPEQDAPAVLKR